ncbi:hypothetical protein FA13DRAFT_872055 [Coprinellus micaceus]|uniref:Uncharacterized protein n=1 Tax=Coprinellus micaceus TaxID=71717 RepID=A0A4Y7S0U2_COPMI|nr:hypothetical protein FA13DRAFT_872055 [Coprinellus micaceus]
MEIRHIYLRRHTSHSIPVSAPLPSFDDLKQPWTSSSIAWPRLAALRRWLTQEHPHHPDKLESRQAVGSDGRDKCLRTLGQDGENTIAKDPGHTPHKYGREPRTPRFLECMWVSKRPGRRW